MKEKIIKFFKIFASLIVNVSKKIIHRLKPRWQFRWIFSFIIWLGIILYLVFGIYFGLQIYKDKSDKDSVKVAAKFYPYPVAFVDGKAIWAKDYYQLLSYIQRYSQKSQQSIGDYNIFKKRTMDQLIENKLLQFEALKYGVKVDDKEVDDAYKKIVGQVCDLLKTEDCGAVTIKKVLNDFFGMTEVQFKKLVKTQVLKEKIQNELIMQAKVSHILIKDEGKAGEIAEKAKKGENFGELAKQYSEDVKSRDNGGDLGWVSREQIVVDNKTIPELDEAIFKSNIGDVVGPVKTSAGFEIVKNEAKKGKVDKSFNQWMDELKKNTKIWKVLKLD